MNSHNLVDKTISKNIIKINSHKKIKEDLANKVTQITEENKTSEVAYPSVKAMTDYVNSIVGAIDTWLQNIYDGEGV